VLSLGRQMAGPAVSACLPYVIPVMKQCRPSTIPWVLSPCCVPSLPQPPCMDILLPHGHPLPLPLYRQPPPPRPPTHPSTCVPSSPGHPLLLPPAGPVVQTGTIREEAVVGMAASAVPVVLGESTNVVSTAPKGP
jgi:hypothetical protein